MIAAHVVPTTYATREAGTARPRSADSAVCERSSALHGGRSCGSASSGGRQPRNCIVLRRSTRIHFSADPKSADSLRHGTRTSRALAVRIVDNDPSEKETGTARPPTSWPEFPLPDRREGTPGGRRPPTRPHPPTSSGRPTAPRTTGTPQAPGEQPVAAITRADVEGRPGRLTACGGGNQPRRARRPHRACSCRAGCTSVLPAAPNRSARFRSTTSSSLTRG
jgi:hypothetical protein